MRHTLLGIVGIAYVALCGWPLGENMEGNGRQDDDPDSRATFSVKQERPRKRDEDPQPPTTSF